MPPLDLARKPDGNGARAKAKAAVAYSSSVHVPDRGDSPSAHIARARLGLVLNYWCSGAGVPRYRLNTCKVTAVARDLLLSQSERGGMTRC